MNHCVYSIDTSAVLDGMKRFYPPETFPGLWQQMGALAASGRLLASEEVFGEIARHDDASKSWMTQHRATLVVATDGLVASEVQRILTSYPKLVANLKNRNRADPFVVAVARMRSATVVTGEGDDGNTNHPKIPYVCAEMNIPCVRFLGLIQSEGWIF